MTLFGIVRFWPHAISWHETANIWTAYSRFFQKIKQPGLHEEARIACSMSRLLADLWHTVWNVIFNDVKCWTRKERFCPLGASLHKLVLGLAIVVNAERFRMHIQIYTYMHKLTSSKFLPHVARNVVQNTRPFSIFRKIWEQDYVSLYPKPAFLENSMISLETYLTELNKELWLLFLLLLLVQQQWIRIQCCILA